ncbi:SAVED domain-containing protein [Litoribacter populi]|uniref:SAVED domain-containing protein n=1 Tax=Litoribacter populi TaxID=2598460 RepID=UPI00117F4C56|nr:SAVED domain-containing protein [Litoribacter populi]
MSVINRVRKGIPGKVARQLWVKSGGRCQYYNCNVNLLEDSLTKKSLNKAYISHIVGASPKGPRGSEILSPKLEIEFDNLMLLCDECHNRIDESDVENHSVSILKEMKEAHEKRIEIVTGLTLENRTNVVTYTANIGNQSASIPFKKATEAILPIFYPNNNRPVELSLHQRSFYDNEELFWDTEETSLTRQFNSKIKPLIETEAVQHYSIFALAPQPLLIKLGTLLSELTSVEVYQPQREPDTWKWAVGDGMTNYYLDKSSEKGRVVALKVELSANITDDRVIEAIGDVPIWSIKIESPDVEFLREREQLIAFKRIVRKMFNEVKALNGQDVELHVFPAMPASAAVEFGRVWNSKADSNLIVYDQNWLKGGFMKTLEISGTKAFV